LTRADAREFLALAPQAGGHNETVPYPPAQANEALADWREGRLQGAAVLVPEDGLSGAKPINCLEASRIAMGSARVRGPQPILLRIRLRVADHPLDRRPQPPQPALDLVDLLVHLFDRECGIDPAVEVDDLAVHGLAHAHVMH